MYICPICNKEFNTDDALTRHFLRCWRKKNPYHKSKSAPHSADINTREDDDDILGFFNSLK